jgi:hypothetical protein
MARSTAGRSPWMALAAGILVVTGLGAIVYGPFLPVPDWIAARLSVPVLGAPPVALVVLEVASIVAAVGVVRVRTWGRALGAVAAVAGIAYSAWRSLQTAPPSATPADVVVALAAGAWLATLLFGIVLFVLVRRWPPPGRAVVAADP